MLNLFAKISGKPYAFELLGCKQKPKITRPNDEMSSINF
jgi:hypothetical protein